MLSNEERELLQAAQSGNTQSLSQLIEPYRYELHLHSYRLLGSSLDAEDAIQETFLRAWTKLDTFQTHGSIRAWLYKIATNTSLNILKQRQRKFAIEADNNPTPPWLEPIPDEWLLKIDEGQSPEDQVVKKEEVHLAFITLLQILPPRQRAVFVFRDVLGWRTKEVAEILDLTVSSVNSLLHRARAHVSAQKHISPISIQEDTSKPLLEKYVRAWETANVDEFVALLVEDATYTMPPLNIWVHGRASIRQFLQSEILLDPSDRQFRCRPIQANKQPGFVIYQWDATTHDYQPLVMQVLTPNATGTQIVSIVNFLNRDLFRLFGL